MNQKKKKKTEDVRAGSSTTFLIEAYCYACFASFVRFVDFKTFAHPSFIIYAICTALVLNSGSVSLSVAAALQLGIDL